MRTITKICTIALSCLTFFTSYSQCYEPGGAGDFEIANLGGYFYSGTNGKGTIALTTDEQYSGSKSLHVHSTVSSVWEIRIFGTNASCYFPIAEDQTITVSFYAKGTIDSKISIAILDGTAAIETGIATLTSSDWTLYKVSIKSSQATANGNIRFIFNSIGDYYIDQIMINEYDCSGEKNGTAAIDACELCSGGSTGLTFNNTCSYKTIKPNSANIRYDGVKEIEYSGDTVSFFRYDKNYSNNSATSGVKVVFRTESPVVKAYFYNDETRTSNTVYWSGYGIFKDGVLIEEPRYKKGEVDHELIMNNYTGNVSEWIITLPAGSAIEFIGLEILDGYDLELIPANDKPVYVSIGNSITQGVGTVFFHTHDTWPALIADSLGFELYNWGVSGSSVSDEILTNFDGTVNPSIISVLWGYNDVHSKPGSNVLNTSTFPEYRALLEGLLTQFPDACVMAVLPTYTDNPNHKSDPTRTIPILRAGELQIIEELDDIYPNLKYFDGEPYTNFDGALHDLVHLSIAGNEALANAFIDEIPNPCGVITSVDQPILELAKVYPNPTNGKVNWEKESVFQILDLSGKMIAQGKAKSFDMTNLSDGIYFLRTEMGMSKIVKK